MRVVCLWSGPRNVSTALMYSFGQRTDTCIVDEPLYGHYLRVSGADHPGRAEVMSAMNCDGDAVMREIVRRNTEDSVIFAKQMAHHLIDIDLKFLEQTTNVFLIRDPKDMLPSLTVQLPDATLADTGYRTQCELLRRLESTGAPALVIDSRLLLENPRGVLAELCEQIGIQFSEEMLAWPAGAQRRGRRLGQALVPRGSSQHGISALSCERELSSAPGRTPGTVQTVL